MGIGKIGKWSSLWKIRGTDSESEGTSVNWLGFRAETSGHQGPRVCWVGPIPSKRGWMGTLAMSLECSHISWMPYNKKKKSHFMLPVFLLSSGNHLCCSIPSSQSHEPVGWGDSMGHKYKSSSGTPSSKHHSLTWTVILSSLCHFPLTGIQCISSLSFI